MLSLPLALVILAVTATFEEVDSADRFRKLFSKKENSNSGDAENKDSAPAIKTPMQEYAAKFCECIGQSMNVDAERMVDVQFRGSGSTMVVDRFIKLGSSGVEGRPDVKTEIIRVPAGFAACTQIPDYDSDKFKNVLKAFLYTPTPNFKKFNLIVNMDFRNFDKGGFTALLNKIDQFPFPEDGKWGDKLVAP